MIIAGERSGVGKTTVTLAILAFLVDRGYKVQSFKVGPDYIDPMFHSYFTGLPCRNLDPVLTSEDYVRTCFAKHSRGVDYCLIEGVMGLFDGIPNDNDILPDRAATSHIARLLNLPVILTLDCSRLSGSVAAIVRGYRDLDRRINIAGVILNRVGSSRHLHILETALESLNIPVLGVLYRQDNLKIPDRHLGLVPTMELEGMEILRSKLTEIAKNCFDWPALLPLLRVPTLPRIETVERKKLLRVGVAFDRAFNFYYADNLDILEEYGAELVFWSPLEGELPDNLDALYFGGGFPEVFAPRLSEKKELLKKIKGAILTGLPTYAECGGLMYLCRGITDFQGEYREMVGIIPETAVMGEKLTLGYREGIVLEDTVILSAGERVRGHEFHKSYLTGDSTAPIYSLKGFWRDDRPRTEGWKIDNLHASYLHLHFGGNLNIVEKFFRQGLAGSGRNTLV